MPTDTDCAYAAGFTDADGSILVFESKHKKYLSGSRFTPYVTIVGIDLPALEWIRDTFQVGSIQKKNHRKDTGPVKARFQTYHLVISQQAALTFCRMIRPYLRIKQRQCDLIIEYYEKALWRKSVPGQRHLPSNEIERRKSLAEMSRFLNQRGYLKRLDDE